MGSQTFPMSWNITFHSTPHRTCSFPNIFPSLRGHSTSRGNPSVMTTTRSLRGHPKFHRSSWIYYFKMTCREVSWLPREIEPVVWTTIPDWIHLLNERAYPCNIKVTNHSSKYFPKSKRTCLISRNPVRRDYQEKSKLSDVMTHNVIYYWKGYLRHFDTTV